MKDTLLFLGTGAADGMHTAFDTGFANRSIRRCSCAMLGDHVLLDCGPHFPDAAELARINLGDITDIVFTHLHEDHFCPASVEAVARAANRTLRLWVREDAALTVPNGCELHPMTLFETYTIGEYAVCGVPANHEAYPQHLSIEFGGKKLFYGMDGAWLLGDTVRYMQGKHYDCVVLDATVGDYSGDYRMGEHNSIPMLRLMADSMRTLEIIDDHTRVILSHMAMCLHKTHEETLRLTQNDPFVIAYDGMEIRV